MGARGLLALALLIVTSAARAEPRAPRVEVMVRAEAELQRGRLDQALKAIGGALKQRKPRALALAGRIHTLRGQLEQAQARFEQVVALHRRGAIEARDVDGLWALAEAAAGLGAYRDANDTFARALAVDPKRSDIELAWSELFITKHALREAQGGIANVLAREPDHARALERMARLELERGADFAKVEALLTRALRSDPELSAAHVTRAGIALRDEDHAAADRHLDAALAINPRDLEALSVRAAVRFVADDQAGFTRAIAQVLQQNPRFSRVYAIVATYAEWEHRYAELVTLSEAALRIDPEDASAHATRGINLLRTGREQEGLAALREAWARDHYDAQVFNLLELYERTLATDYETFDVGEVHLRMPRQERALLEPYAVPLITRALDVLGRRYGPPAQRTHVEFYASPEHFAVRATGLPQLGVQGLCFGNVVIALSPRGGEFNWGQIVWHELSHVFHVQRSRGRVPRWFTEGLAEWETMQARPEWKREDDRPLYDALQRGELPPLADFNRAFTHATDPRALTVAYYASALAIDYLVRQHGAQVLPAMLTLWGEGASTEQVMQRALGRSLEDLSRGFMSSLHTRLTARYQRDMRVDLADYRDLNAWRQRSASPAATSEDHAGLALALAVSGETDAAVRRATALLQGGPSPLARFTLVHVALERGDLSSATRELDALFAAGNDGYQLRMLRARVAERLEDRARAIEELERAVAIDADRDEAYDLLARVAGDAATKERALLAMARLDQHRRAPLLRALALLRSRRAYAEQQALAESGLYLDVHVALFHLALAEALAQQGRRAEARVEAQRALALSNQRERAEVSALLRALDDAERGSADAGRGAGIADRQRKSR